VATSRQEELNDEAHALLWREMDAYARSQVERILENRSGELEPEFLGFLGPYMQLSRIVSENRVVYDVGCSSAVQAWFFRNHTRYVGIDPGTASDRLHLRNTEHFRGTLEEGLRCFPVADDHFTICNYVPPWYGDCEALVRATFRHLFVFYPSRHDHPVDLTPLLRGTP